MIKRWMAFLLSMILLVGICVPAQADIAMLEKSLSRWMATRTSVRFSAVMQVKALNPFPQEKIDLLNAVLGHVQVNASVEQDGEATSTFAQIAVDGESMMDWSERSQNELTTLETSLLPNRTLQSAIGSPMDILSAETLAQPEEEPDTLPADAAVDTDETATVTAAPATTDDAEGTTDAEPSATKQTKVPAATKAPADTGEAETVQITQAKDAFDLLDAVEGLQECYQALTDGIQPYAEEKTASYKIKNIGAGKWSRVARLTTEQSDALLTEIRAVLACGMDDAYRAEIDQMTFQKGFIVALYRNADQQDICVYMKGTVNYPDGSKRKLSFQWAFTSNGLKRTDTYKYELTKSSGTTESRVIDGLCTQESRSDAFSIDDRAETTLKRGKTVDKCTMNINLSGKGAQEDPMTCKGKLSRAVSLTENGDKTLRTETVDVDLLMTPDDDGTTLSGSLSYQDKLDKTVETELHWTLAESVPQAFTDAASENGLYRVNGSQTNPAQTNDADNATQSISATDTPEEQSAPDVEVTVNAAADTADTAAEPSSLELIDETVVTTAGQDSAAADHQDTTATDSAAYLVGNAPAGLQAFTAPDTAITVDLDTADAASIRTLMQEAAQALAGKLIVAIGNLSGEDAAWLKDGMTDTDWAAFEALLGEL